MKSGSCEGRLNVGALRHDLLVEASTRSKEWHARIRRDPFASSCPNDDTPFLRKHSSTLVRSGGPVGEMVKGHRHEDEIQRLRPDRDNFGASKRVVDARITLHFAC